MTIIILVRHAESGWVKKADASPIPLFGGRMNDCQLSDEGQAQSRKLGTYIERGNIKPDALYSSPADRALDTCRLSVGREPIIVTDLQELTWGDWEGGPRSIQNEEPFKTRRLQEGFDFAPPNGESPNQVRDRAMRELWDIHKRNHDCVLIFTHRNVIKNLIRDFMGWNTPELLDKAVISVCSLTTVRFVSQTQLQVVRYNEKTI